MDVRWMMMVFALPLQYIHTPVKEKPNHKTTTVAIAKNLAFGRYGMGFGGGSQMDPRTDRENLASKPDSTGLSLFRAWCVGWTPHNNNGFSVDRARLDHCTCRPFPFLLFFFFPVSLSVFLGTEPRQFLLFCGARRPLK